MLYVGAPQPRTALGQVHIIENYATLPGGTPSIGGPFAPAGLPLSRPRRARRKRSKCFYPRRKCPGLEELRHAAGATSWRSDPMSREPSRQAQPARTLDAAGTVLDERPARRLGKPLDLFYRPVAQSPSKKHAFSADIRIRLGVGGAPGAPSAPMGPGSIPRLCGRVPCRTLDRGTVQH